MVELKVTLLELPLILQSMMVKSEGSVKPDLKKIIMLCSFNYVQRRVLCIEALRSEVQEMNIVEYFKEILRVRHVSYKRKNIVMSHSQNSLIHCHL